MAFFVPASEISLTEKSDIIMNSVFAIIAFSSWLFTLIVWLFQQRKKNQLQKLYEEQRTQYALLTQQSESLKTQYQEAFSQQKKYEQQVFHLNTQLREAETRLDVEREHFQHKLEELQHTKVQEEQQLLARFENLSQKLLDQYSRQFKSLNQDSLQQTLTPFAADLKHFRQAFQDSHQKESEQRQHLKFELQRLAELNQQITQDATALTQALKGDSKTQGCWGEIVLERVLEASGLRAGQEYESQPTLKDAQGKIYRPDVLVHLPGKRCIIIDAKVSLTAYQRYCQAEDPDSQREHLQAHIRSIKQHIQNLSSKGYQRLEQIETLDYMLMFMPVEPAFMLAVGEDATLIALAHQQNILFVGPTNLFVALRTIDHLWRVERKNQNAQEIAKRAYHLYDKFRLLITEFEQLGTYLNKAQDSQQKIFKRLVSGRDNIIRKIENFREMGIEVKQPIPAHLLEEAPDLEQNQE